MQNLSIETINDTGFDKIQLSLSSLSNSESNYLYFENLMPHKNLEDLANHLSLSDTIYKAIIRMDDVDICQVINMADIISKIKIKGTHLSEQEFKNLYNILEINLKLKHILSDSSFSFSLANPFIAEA